MSKKQKHESLQDTLKICCTLLDITKRIISVVDQRETGKIVMCNCQEENILLLPSMKDDFKQFHQSDCDDKTSSSVHYELSSDFRLCLHGSWGSSIKTFQLHVYF